MERISLSHFTVVHRIDDRSKTIEVSLKERISKYSYFSFSIALDESTDLSNTARLVVFIRGVTENFEVIDEFLIWKVWN